MLVAVHSTCVHVCALCCLWLATHMCVCKCLVTSSEYAAVRIYWCMLPASCVCIQVVELFTCMGQYDYEWDSLITIGMVIL